MGLIGLNLPNIRPIRLHKNSDFKYNKRSSANSLLLVLNLLLLVDTIGVALPKQKKMQSFTSTFQIRSTRSELRVKKLVLDCLKFLHKNKGGRK